MKTFSEIDTEIAALIPEWKRKRKPAAAVWSYVHTRRPADICTIGQWETLAGITNRTAFWLDVAREAGPGQDAAGEWKDMKLGISRLKWRWAIRIMRRLRQ